MEYGTLKSSNMFYCSKENISIRNYQMHELHCNRHIVLCERCKMPVKRDALDDHKLDYHTEVRCDQCGQAMENGDLDKHKVVTWKAL